MSKKQKQQFLHGYPRPQLQRENWLDLNGQWDFFIDHDGRIDQPARVKFNKTITVPFAPETPASGIEETGFFKACWYRKQIDAQKLAPGERFILRFEAVDFRTNVWVNDKHVAWHEGGYTPFWADITDALVRGQKNTIVVRSEDDPHDMAQPRGKQDWKEHPHSIWYYRTSGIWQSVWAEKVNASRIERIRWGADAVRWEISLHARIKSPGENSKLRVHLHHHGKTLSDDTYAITSGEIERIIVLPDPGIEDARGDLLWSPFNPNLIDADLELIDAEGKILDAVKSYTAMRSVHISRDRLMLNGRPMVLQLLLDQGYWPETGLTAPNDEAFKKDIELVQAMGFNGVRKHQKIESQRFLYWADKLGLLVWEEMPSVYTFNSRSMRRLTREWMQAMERDASHPCIIAWVPFNESWGVPDLPINESQRHAIQALYHLTKTFDPSRPVIGNDGWEAAATDIVGIHDYDANPNSVKKRYDATDRALENILRQERPGYRVLLLENFEYKGQPIMLTEFGGIAFSKDQQHTWGYSRATSSEDFASRYYHLLHAVRNTPTLAGFCYTQFTDTYQEANGLLYMDRTPKIPIEHIAVATRGARNAGDEKIEAKWR